jgi:predicted molibdopterin-dependent oxidoreductase YjgC
MRRMGTMNAQLRGVTVADSGGIGLHPHDAAVFGVGDGAQVVVRSAHGSTSGTVHVDDRVGPGSVSMTHAWSEPDAGAVTSMSACVDPLTGMPQFSGVPVTIEPAVPGDEADRPPPVPPS